MESPFRTMALNALFPRFCFGCGAEGTLWCLSCAEVWWPVRAKDGCPFCGEDGTFRTCTTCRESVYLDGLIAFAPYANPVVHDAIRYWKYVGDEAAARTIHGWLARFAPLVAGVFADASFVPVPLHPRKRRARGFDQAGEIADWMSSFFSRPAYDVLIRVRANSSQGNRQRNERNLGELDGLFAIHPRASWLPERVVLCDDVFTSGTTMDAAARVLKEAGIKRVLGFTIAK